MSDTNILWLRDWSLASIFPVEPLSENALVQVKLLQRDPLVGLVSLLDRPGPEDHRFCVVVSYPRVGPVHTSPCRPKMAEPPMSVVTTEE